MTNIIWGITHLHRPFFASIYILSSTPHPSFPEMPVIDGDRIRLPTGSYKSIQSRNQTSLYILFISSEYHRCAHTSPAFAQLYTNIPLALNGLYSNIYSSSNYHPSE